MKNKLNITIGWLYPALMSTYGDRGNIRVLQKRCAWQEIDTTIIPIDTNSNPQDLKKIDMIFGGGAQDKEQGIVMRDLKNGKGEIIKKRIEDGLPALFVCGSPQLMGKFYEPSEGKRIDGLGIFDIETYHSGDKDNRLIGNIAAEIIWGNLNTSKEFLLHNAAQKNNDLDNLLIGFENHGGRTNLGAGAKPLAKVKSGQGNNGRDGTEGVVYKNAIGTYLHGPLLPKNPVLADYLISLVLYIKYNQIIKLAELNADLETKARNIILSRMNLP